MTTYKDVDAELQKKFRQLCNVASAAGLDVEMDVEAIIGPLPPVDGYEANFDTGKRVVTIRYSPKAGDPLGECFLEALKSTDMRMESVP